ncbi:hypothetical protein TWF730_009152 [Orbilia blumenaviensis]|uniref:Uncharacterized protein n=1 Tax=Orbilia blumenaviensis TaxID=1796055 RepID=A0AAV9V081_9PEZI
MVMPHTQELEIPGCWASPNTKLIPAPTKQGFEDIDTVLQCVISNRRTMNPHIFGSSMFTFRMEISEDTRVYSYEAEGKYFSQIDLDLRYLESLEASSSAESATTKDHSSERSP